MEILQEILAVPETDTAETLGDAGESPGEVRAGENGHKQPHPNDAINQPDFPPRVYFSDLNADSLNIFVVYWYHPAVVRESHTYCDLCQDSTVARSAPVDRQMAAVDVARATPVGPVPTPAGSLLVVTRPCRETS
jgi:hypothetical protein